MSSLKSQFAIRQDLLEQLTLYLKEANLRSSYTGLAWIKIENAHALHTSLGFLAGQKVIVDLGRQLLDIAQFENCLFSPSEAEFVLILPFLKNPVIAELAIEKIKQALVTCEQDNDTKQKLIAHIGVGVNDSTSVDATELCLLSETALNQAASSTKKLAILNNWQSLKSASSMNIEEELNRAIEQSELELYFQPKINIKEKTVYSFEVLLRWNRGGTYIPPDQFIPQAEKSDVIFAMTKWVIHSALRALKALQDQHKDTELKVSINISKPCFTNNWLEDVLKNALSIWNVNGANVILEITETAFMEGLKTIQKCCSGIRNSTGCQISIDDFGTGFSSFEFFKEVHAEELKIDKTFVTNINQSSRLQNIVRCMVDLAKSANMKIVVEGIETEEELKEILALDVDYTQGYLFSRPLAELDLALWMKNKIKHVESSLENISKHSG